MNWNDLTQNWGNAYGELRREFPKLEKSAMPFLKGDQDRFESYLAATHDLTLDEARAAFDAFLARKARDLLTA